MAADRGRDLKLNLLSDASRFEVDQPARDLDNLGDAAQKVDRKLEDFEDRARQTAKRVVDAFRDISKGSHRHLKEDLDDDLDDAKRGLDDFKDEAAGSGREAAASFGGEFGDIKDLIQETAAQAFAGFGPLGAAAGVAAAVGIGVVGKLFDSSKEKAEEAKAAVQEWVDAFVEGQGKITAATVDAKLSDILGDREQYEEIIRLTDAAGVSAVTYARALAGDAKAAQEVKDQIMAQQQALIDGTAATSDNAAAAGNQAVQLQKVAEKLGISTGQIGKARDQWKLLDEATRAGITAEVKVSAPSPKELDEINRRIRNGVGTIVVPLQPGQTKYSNTANNSKYRW